MTDDPHLNIFLQIKSQQGLTLHVVQGDTGPICKWNAASSVECSHLYNIG